MSSVEMQDISEANKPLGGYPVDVTFDRLPFDTKEFLKQYAVEYEHSPARIRVALMNKLLELANSGDPKAELKAIELIGKMSDIGVFTERTEITVTHKNSKELENSIREKLERIVQARIPQGKIIDVTATPIKPNQNEEH